MKTRNIITIISVLFALVSCSAESDILDDIPAQNQVNSEKEAVISCSVNNVITKATVTEDEAISSVVYFLLDKNNDVLAYKSGSESGASFLSKNQEGLKVLAVANAATDVTVLDNEAAIMNQILNERDLTSLVKVGCSEVKFSASSDPTLVIIEVSQVAARLDLSRLNMTIKDADKVTLESVELVNQNKAGRMNGATDQNNFGKVTESLNIDLMIDNKVDNVCHFYSFANSSIDYKTALILNFDIDGKKVSKEVTIKNKTKEDKVVSGANHQLTINVTIQGENVMSEVVFTVADWRKSETSVDMEEK